MRKSTILKRKNIEDFKKVSDLERRLTEVLKVHEVADEMNKKINNLERRISNLGDCRDEDGIRLQRAKEEKNKITKVRDNIVKINMIIIKYDFDINKALSGEKNILYVFKLIPLGEKTRLVEVNYSIKSENNYNEIIGNNEVFSIIELNEEKTDNEINENHKREIMKQRTKIMIAEGKEVREKSYKVNINSQMKISIAA